ncbi:M20/M25/M40 family metallo-hydrolase [Streptomyces sp. NBC_01142]|uniref:M20/M25/M40 family metallo-hydrolase n=1 Tax=Streptomyces sp. NBC_01142 TaxID=2975865 RepID=UPI00224EE434|nr:M20/M25/M40 family metallo-hydrolase [Streptomyces sp. NBC_01142]MCX4820779.1 M20/M25/M40 family metallo-hydrolase [Streptomyces sp. NBC_01142]
MSTSSAVDPVPLLQDLIRINTTNPPGNEIACAQYLVERLAHRDDLDIKIVGRSRDRANLIVRFPGRGIAPPLLLHGHSDVVPVSGQDWQHPPFEATLVDGEVWGRGSIDMKGGLAMMLSSLARLHQAGERPPGDVVLAVVADEEHGSLAGARWLVREHPELFAGIRCAIGEEGGAGIELGGRRFHPIVVAEKRACWFRATLRGPGGHASRLTPPGTPMEQLGRLLTALTGVRLPRHQEPAAYRMLTELAGALPEPLSAAMRGIRDDNDGDAPPAGLPMSQALQIDSLLRNTVNPTIVRTSDKINVVPAEITVDLDGRILPGAHTREEFLSELRALTGPDLPLDLLVEGLQVVQDRIEEPEFGGFYETLADITRKADPDAVPLPMMSPASTDAGFFAQLGIRCYGWLPMKLPAGSDHRTLLHSANERIPVEALEFGTECLTSLLRDYR